MDIESTSEKVSQSNSSLNLFRAFGFLANFKLIPEIDKNPTLVKIAQSVQGKFLVLLAFSIGLFASNTPYWQELSIILSLFTFFPAQRKIVLLVATCYWLVDVSHPQTSLIRYVAEQLVVVNLINWSSLRYEMLASVLIFCTTFYALVYKFRDTVLMSRPVTLLVILYVVIIYVASSVALPPLQLAYMWAFIITFKLFIWFLAYSLLDIRSKNPTPYFYQLGYYQAFWHGGYLSGIPFPKGARYLKKIEVKTAQEYAICQLKAIKLLYWAFILTVLHTLFVNIVYGDAGTLGRLVSFSFYLNAERMAFMLGEIANGRTIVGYEAWYSLWAKLIDVTFFTAIMGHIIIACVRMSGYLALRSTYKPFYATTLAEFWNRYFYYFKEFLVEFFFYPVYLRYFKKWPQFRLFFATLCAAGFGNVLFHFLYSPKRIFELGLWQAIVSFQVYIFYGIIFGMFIAISQLKNHRHRGVYPWYRKWITGPLCVFGFFSLVLIFDELESDFTLIDHFRFVLFMFGLQG